ncbi:O-acetylhomoserine aminocarboxypropyltransferase/cysteine synthase family protein [Acidobacteriota bacterium]
MMRSDFKLSTKLLHAGQEKSWQARTRAVPIYQTGSYIFQDSDQAARAFNLEVEDHLYGRMSNPTAETLEKKIAAMDNGKTAVAFSSGMAAISNTILNICKQGDNIVSSQSLYGGTRVLFDRALRELGIKCHFVDNQDLNALEAAVSENNAKLFFTEGIGNPKNDLPDFDGVARICQQYQVPFIIDNTLTPGLIDPSRYGIDIVIYSLSKYISGHGTVIGGIVVDMGHFNWQNARYPFFTEPDPSYNNKVFAEEEAPFSLRLRGHMLRNFGAPLRPLEAFLSIIGLETLPLRMERICATANTLATRLLDTKGVEWVNYPGVGIGSEAGKRLHYFNGKGGGITCFGLGSAGRSKKFADSLKIITHMANMGDVRTLIQHCASTSHAQLSENELIEGGIKPDLLRLSVGLEDVEDLWEDILTALARVAN